MNFLETFAGETWLILNEAAPYVLFGFAVAALVKALVPDDLVARHLGRNSYRSVLKASILGVPLPLCSCGVIPAAAGLRRQGASKGATTAFLISTPETGADSIAVTWALLDPVMTILRPLSALITATAAGLIVNALPDEKTPAERTLPMAHSCGCGGACATPAHAETTRPPLPQRIKDGFRHAFGEMLADIGVWLLAGTVAAALISALVPAGFIENSLGGELGSLVVMLVIGVPLYICATSSTPIAASLALKGLSPGAALVFLLAGPATNTATIAVVSHILGRKAVVAYIGTIAVCSLALGWLTNRLYAALGLDIASWIHKAGTESTSVFSIVCTVLLLALIARSVIMGRKHGHNHSH
ncbi:hypothetical protein GGQ74_002645 [Desulfobaculum xiamenense]|uniref:Permease n=1 Tax=Desulfobaculum xiamenense TaxID=995050 RepID=A0A846QLG9_9BACT|nr:SO_0444 family Cu/Zn efflux transporter [Desulfobaculum xiamenense]NJB68951.1 hypothetical protein [Desulfobaculum xiamenense]